MKQVVQSLADGRTEVIDVPAPQARPGHLLVATHASLLSAGTERMLLEFGRAGLLGKIRQQPDKVRQVIDKFRADGLWPTLEAVRSRLAQPVPMGYSNVGTVLDVGAGMTGFEPGDRVVSNGPHAEVVCVPKNLCARVPEAVSDDAAAFTVVGSIALEGLRLARPTLGESFAVIGLGLVGLLAVQLLRANGCRVLGLDFDRDRLALSERFGAETIDLSCVDDPVPHALRFAGGGVDGVLICAATQKNDPAAHAARMCRKRGRIVLVGVCGLELSRADFYEKELSFQVSCSYGPGRYDAAYEQGGRDYPLPFVRWTAQRNFGAVLDLLGSGRLDTAPLVTHCYPIERAIEAYGVLGGGAPSLGILLEYAAAANAALEAASAPDAGGLLARSVSLVAARASVEHAGRIRGSAPVGVGFIGVGEFAVRVLLPAFRAAGADVRCVAGRNGLTAAHAARKFSIPEATTDARRILDDPACAAVVIATRHDSHAEYVRQALEAGKHVFVEKPLAITAEQLDTLEDAFAEAPWRDGSSPLVMVGFNRRFSPHVRKMQELLDGVVEPKSFLYTVNAGAIPAGH
ncbi:MAG: bi-domain-containing oxidoreductase, partial [Planctomycetes bacterium]|nr:bi-domain-containing oxidoreductase [Planctomycetota bacterium]